MFMYRFLFTVGFLLAFCISATSQSIPSYWMNIYPLENYYELRNQKAVSIDVEKTGYYASGEMYKEKWIYNFIEPNRVIGELFLNGELKTKFTYIFDNSNQRVKNEFNTKYPALGWKHESIVFEYSAEGNKIAEKRFDGNDQLIGSAMFRYDSLNHLVRITNNDPAGNILSFETADYDYNKSVYLYKVFDSTGSLVSHKLNYCNIDSTSNIRNNLGDHTKVVWPTSSPDKEVYHEFAYKYDAYGNWTHRVWFVITNGKKEKRSIVKRKIKYRS